MITSPNTVQGRAPSVVVGLAELIVLRIAEGVAETTAPQACAGPLLEAEGRCVILAFTAGRRFRLQQVAELWEGTQ